jgi:hypothetical protein
MADGTQTGSMVVSNDLPAWYQQYTQNLAQQAASLASANNTGALPANSVAGFNQDQQQAFANLRANQGVWQSGLDTAGTLSGQIAPTAAKFIDYAQGAVGAPAFATAESIQPWAQGAQDAASGSAGQTAGSANEWANQILTAAGGTADQTAANVKQYATDADTAVAGSAQDWTSNYSKYMNPYTSEVVDNIARLGKRNWEDSIMPGVNSSMIGSGQFGSTRNADILTKAGLNANLDILGQQSNALQSGYNSAASIFGTDANRAQQQAQLQANTSLAGGNMMQGAYAADANRNLQQQQNLIGATQNAGNLYTSNLANDYARQQAQQQLQANTAISGGNMMQGALSADANRIQNQGQLQANTALSGATGAVNALNTASDNSGALAQMYQSMGQTDVNNLAGVGAQQQALQQRGYDTAFGNAQLARTDPWTQLTNAQGVLGNIKLPTVQSTAQSGQIGNPPTTTDSLASAFFTTAGLLNGGTKPK